jgi:hypothetical protein
MALANTLAYYDTATITAKKYFIVEAPGVHHLFLSKQLLFLRIGGATREPGQALPGNTGLGGRLSTYDLLIKVACFLKRLIIFSI